MGVPLHRPTAPDFFPDVLDPTWLDVFRFCTVRDLGACLAVARSWRLVADSHHVWVDAYNLSQRVDSTSAPGGECFRALIERPFGEDAVGWRVSVLMEDGTERYASGNILAYCAEADAYLVSYDGTDGMPQNDLWEQERRKRTAAMWHNPSLAGKSRFSFIAPPSSWHAPGNARGGGAGRGQLRFNSWKQELENNVRSAPSRLLYRLEQHTDEVLFVVFSPCGTRLASCSRDLRTIVFSIRHSDSQCKGARRSDPTFEQEAVLRHQTAPCRVIWWPVAPYNQVVVSTEDAGWQGVSKVEIWEIVSGTRGATLEPAAEGLPVGVNTRCVFRGQNRPFDIYGAIFPWPIGASGDPSALGTSMCFVAGWAVFRENEHYVQWLNVWPGPGHPRFRAGQEPADETQSLAPLARLRLEADMNYLHCLEVGGPEGRRVLAMTGSTPHLCDEIALIDLGRITQRDDRDAPIPTYGAQVEVRSMGQRVVLSAKWNQSGDLIVLNTRPYAQNPQTAQTGSARQPQNLSFEDLLLRPAPDLSTSMELLVLDARTLDSVGVFDGHFAFTTKDSPFLIFTDEWGQSDFLASGGEDHRVYVWHRRHRRLLRRLCGHTEPVNAVSWSKGLLASASDDHCIIIWSTPLTGSDSRKIA